MKKEIYKGHVITYKCGIYMTLGQCFKTLKMAKKEIENLVQIIINSTKNGMD